MTKDDKPNNIFIRLKRFLFELPVKTKQGLHHALGQAEKHNVINRYSLEMIESVIQIANMQVRDIMTPRSKMIGIDFSMKLPEMLKVISDSSYSRFPVFYNDQVRGILLVKDMLLHYIEKQNKKINISDYLRPHITAPESKTLVSLLREFQLSKNHMAIVVDEYSMISGLVTIEDILEQIVGEIEDEHDFEEDNIIDHGDGRYLIRASMPVVEFNKFFNSALDDQGVDTISGLILSKFGRMPERLEKIVLGEFNFRILKSDSRRLYLVEVSKI